MQTSEKTARDSNLIALFEVLKFIEIPSKCHHILMEEYFENPVHSVVEKEACGLMCSFCVHEYTATGCIHRDRLQYCLITFFTYKCPAPKDLLQYIKHQKLHIFHKNNVPNKFMGPVHALCLQLVATRIIDMSVHADKQSLIGKRDLNIGNVVLCLGVDDCKPQILKDCYWERITIVNTMDACDNYYLVIIHYNPFI
jgi:hypothetical protein